MATVQLSEAEVWGLMGLLDVLAFLAKSVAEEATRYRHHLLAARLEEERKRLLEGLGKEEIPVGIA